MTTLDAQVGHLSADRADRRAFSVNYTYFAAAIAGILTLFIGYRIYQQAYAFSTGLDATTQEFHDTWMVLFYIQTPILWSLPLLAAVYLFFTRDRDILNVPPAVELRRYFNLTMWLVAYSFMIYWTGSFFAEGDGNWHQTVLRDTPITPSHIVLFYACIPVYVFFGVGAFVYAMTRIPAFAKGLSVTFIFAVVGPFLILPNLGYNEWGHAYWLTEEIFSHPLHWGFVVLGWNALALAGVLMQMLNRMRVLFPIVFGDMAKQDRAAVTN